MATGTVKRIVSDRRYGFVEAADVTELFFHRNDLIGIELWELGEGQRVEFDVEEGSKGLSAVRVRKMAG